MAIPLLVRHPQGIAKGRELGALVQHVDLYPTILEAAGVPIPDHLDGRSLLPLMRGEQTAIRDVGFYGAFGQAIHVSDGRYTLFVTDPEGPQGPPRLFDIETDPNQERNIVQVQPGLARKLYQALSKKIEQENPPAKIKDMVKKAGEFFS